MALHNKNAQQGRAERGYSVVDQGLLLAVGIGATTIVLSFWKRLVCHAIVMILAAFHQVSG